MKFKNRIDMHIHTDNSPDGHHSTTLISEYAVKVGLRAIAITDHCECNHYAEGRYERSTKQSFFESAKCRSVFSGRLLVLLGIELGQATQDFSAAQEAITSNNYDFILGSLHNVEGEPDFWEIDFTKRDYKELLDRYFAELLKLTQWGKFDSLAHLTYPLRYITGEYGIEVNLSPWQDTLDEIYKLLISRGQALEINTSGLYQKYGRFTPELEQIKRFKSLGGENITIGSDAHYAQNVGNCIEDGMDIALEAGFKYTAIYQQRILLPIEIK